MSKVILSRGTEFTWAKSGADWKTRLVKDTEVDFVAWSKESGGTYILNGRTIFVAPEDNPDHAALVAACED